MNNGTYYWIALNGASCARSIISMPDHPTVIPTPETLIGFPTLEESAEVQHICLTAPLDEVRIRLESLRTRDDVRKYRFPNPQPPTHEPTMWWSE